MKLNSWEINQQRGWVKKNIAYKKRVYCIKLSKNAESNHQEELWVRFLTVRARLEWIILAVWIAHFPYFFLLGNEPAKKKTTAYVRLKLNLNPPPIRVSRLFAESPLPVSAYLLYWWPPGPLQKQNETGSFHTVDGEIP